MVTSFPDSQDFAAFSIKEGANARKIEIYEKQVSIFTCNDQNGIGTPLTSNLAYMYS